MDNKNTYVLMDIVKKHRVDVLLTGVGVPAILNIPNCKIYYDGDGTDSRSMYGYFIYDGTRNELNAILGELIKDETYLKVIGIYDN